MSEFVSGEEVKKLALLARIEISPAEVKKLQKDLGAILDYVSQLKGAPSPVRRGPSRKISIPSEVPTTESVGTESISPTPGVGAKAPEIFNVFREDEPVKGEADIKKGEHIKVKHIF